MLHFAILACALAASPLGKVYEIRDGKRQEIRDFGAIQQVNSGSTFDVEIQADVQAYVVLAAARDSDYENAVSLEIFDSRQTRTVVGEPNKRPEGLNMGQPMWMSLAQTRLSGGRTYRIRTIAGQRSNWYGPVLSIKFYQSE